MAIFVQLCCCVKQNTAKKKSLLSDAVSSVGAMGRAVGSLGVSVGVSLPDGQIGGFFCKAGDRSWGILNVTGLMWLKGCLTIMSLELWEL